MQIIPGVLALLSRPRFSTPLAHCFRQRCDVAVGFGVLPTDRPAVVLRLTWEVRKPFSVFYLLAGAFQFLGDELFVGKDSLILRGQHLAGQIVECIVGFCRSFFGAQNESDRWVLAGFHPMLTGVVQIEMHLPSVRIAESTDLEIDEDEGPQAAVEEDEVNTKPRVVDTKPALAAEEGKIIT